MIGSHKIMKSVSIAEFTDKIKNYHSEDIVCTKHTFFRLSGKQRKIFTCEKIKEYLFETVPVFVGVQYNKCHAAFYKYEKQRFIRIILDIKISQIYVVTFYVIEKNQLPVVK